MHQNLTRQTAVGDSFFHNIRGLSLKKNIGFILIGGENMDLIRERTDKLNTFNSKKVDYFKKKSHK